MHGRGLLTLPKLTHKIKCTFLQTSDRCIGCGSLCISPGCWFLWVRWRWWGPSSPDSAAPQRVCGAASAARHPPGWRTTHVGPPPAGDSACPWPWTLAGTGRSTPTTGGTTGRGGPSASSTGPASVMGTSVDLTVDAADMDGLGPTVTRES